MSSYCYIVFKKSGIKLSMRLLVATTNAGKIREYYELLAGLNCELLSLENIGIADVVMETGASYTENAVLKARIYSAQSRLLTLADDSGLEVDALNGRPGVHSARYAAGSLARIHKLLAEMEDVPDDQRSARFQCVIALASPDGHWETAQGTCEGRIAREPRGSHGFGFDPVFYLPEYGVTLAELPERFKNTISHRACAAQKIRPVLERILSEY
jgi:XTP/dITP diphosphohydrolase